MVTAEHMNQLLKNVLKLIKKNIGNENAPWMTRIATYTQQIIINSSEELLRESFLPLAERVRKRTDNMYHKEESLRGFIKVSNLNLLSKKRVKKQHDFIQSQFDLGSIHRDFMWIATIPQSPKSDRVFRR